MFFEMPLSPPMRLAPTSAVGRRNAETFREWAAVRGISVLRMRRECGLSAFPDAWHMSASAADVFTGDLIDTCAGRR
ncbi:MAG: hypothetical protein O2917_04755 [Acidobacteria bacterium]|nr:hypothetical protein [Acidobacteriota bacterium]